MPKVELEPGALSRRRVLGAAAATVVAGSMAGPYLQRARALTYSECVSACNEVHAHSVDRAVDKCQRGMRILFGGAHWLLYRSVYFYLNVGVCVGIITAQDAAYRDRCIAACSSDCGLGEGGECKPPGPVAAGGLTPPPIAVANGGQQPSGCGCVGSDTCCPCSGFLEGGSDVGLCCIYIDCRCCPGAA
jgi:hypothetical protein